jgi:hypothetical protein
MSKKDSLMNRAVALVAVKHEKTMIVVAVVKGAAVAVVVLKVKEPSIVLFVHAVEPKPKSHSNRNKIGKFYAEIAFAPKIVTDNFNDNNIQTLW